MEMKACRKIKGFVFHKNKSIYVVLKFSYVTQEKYRNASFYKMFFHNAFLIVRNEKTLIFERLFFMRFPTVIYISWENVFT